jgi:metal-responsive CopG/Arc/MetJ family transcriptional regulator
MQVVIEIDKKLTPKIIEAARLENKSPSEFVNATLRETLQKVKNRETDEEKVKRFIESYEKFPQQPDEYEIWQDEQVWENE